DLLDRSYGRPRLRSFPTRRSSDLETLNAVLDRIVAEVHDAEPAFVAVDSFRTIGHSIRPGDDRAMIALAEFVHRLGQQLTSWERSEEHTSELQSLRHLVCRLPLEK